MIVYQQLNQAVLVKKWRTRNNLPESQLTKKLWRKNRQKGRIKQVQFRSRRCENKDKINHSVLLSKMLVRGMQSHCSCSFKMFLCCFLIFSKHFCQSEYFFCNTGDSGDKSKPKTEEKKQPDKGKKPVEKSTGKSTGASKTPAKPTTKTTAKTTPKQQKSGQCHIVS